MFLLVDDLKKKKIIRRKTVQNVQIFHSQIIQVPNICSNNKINNKKHFFQQEFSVPGKNIKIVQFKKKLDGRNGQQFSILIC